MRLTIELARDEAKAAKDEFNLAKQKSNLSYAAASKEQKKDNHTC